MRVYPYQIVAIAADPQRATNWLSPSPDSTLEFHAFSDLQRVGKRSGGIAYDGVLINLNQPGDNFTLIGRLVRFFSHLPVVAICGSQDRALIAHAIRLGVQDVIVDEQYDFHRLERTLVCSVERWKATVRPAQQPSPDLLFKLRCIEVYLTQLADTFEGPISNLTTAIDQSISPSKRRWRARYRQMSPLIDIGNQQLKQNFYRFRATSFQNFDVTLPKQRDTLF